MLAMLAVAHIAPSNAAAQYPTPKGALLCTSGVITAQTNSSFQFTATLVDIMGAPVPGNTVNFIVSGNATLSTTSATTDGNGQASTTVNTTGGGGQIVVSAAIDQFVCRAVINVPVEVPNIQCNISQLYQFNSQYNFTVTLRSTTTVLIGQTINFYISSTGGGASLSQIAAITDGSGSASVIVYVLPTSGSVTVTAQYNGLTCPATINVVPPPPPTCQYPNQPQPGYVPGQPGYCAAPPPPTYVQQYVPPVQYIVPPVTGDAGLATKSSSSHGATEAAAGLTLIAAVAGIALLARRMSEVHDVTK
jgi:hypothetical protein